MADVTDAVKEVKSSINEKFWVSKKIFYRKRREKDQ